MYRLPNIIFILILSLCVGSCMHHNDAGRLLDNAEAHLEMHPDSAKFYGVDNRLYVAELSIDRLFELINTTKTFKPFSKFPTMERDLAVVVDEEVAVGDMLDAVSGGKIKYLTDLTAFDTYRSDAIGKDKKSVALSFTFASLEGTLKDDDINGEMNRILSILKRRFGAKIRG